MLKGHKRLGEILVEKGLITEAQLHDALSEQRVSPRFLGLILMTKNLITNHDLLKALSEQFDMPIVDLKTEYIDMELARKFTSSLILDHKCFPLHKDGNEITVAIVNPLDALAIARVEDEARPNNVKFVLVDDVDIEAVFVNYRKYINQSIQRLLQKDRKPNE